jgi:hypothetical protein
MKRKKVEAFVKVPLWWIATAADATGSPAVLVLIELLPFNGRRGACRFRYQVPG